MNVETVLALKKRLEQAMVKELLAAGAKPSEVQVRVTVVLDDGSLAGWDVVLP